MDNIAEDIYTIQGLTSNKSIQIDLTTPFVLNSISTIINVSYEDILIKNSLGELVEKIEKEKLLKIEEEEITYYFINLVDILFDPLEIEGYVYSKLYPLIDLKENEYGLINGSIITGKDIIVKVKGIELLKTIVETNKIINYSNGNYIKRLDDNFTYYNDQIVGKDNTNTVIKLNNVSIEKGSLILEDYYEEGELYYSKPEDNRKYLNVGTTEEPNYIIVDEEDPNMFIQE